MHGNGRRLQKGWIPLFVAYYRRMLPAFRKVKSLVEEGTIGAVRYAAIELCQPASDDFANLPWRLVPEISGGGYFFDLASHQLDFLDYLLGPIAAATGHATNQAGRYAVEDAVTASFAFASGAGTGCGILPPTRARTALKSSATRAASASRLCLYSHRADHRRRLPNLRLLIRPYVQQPLVRTVVDALLGRGECPNTGESATRTSRVMDLIVYGHARRPPRPRYGDSLTATAQGSLHFFRCGRKPRTKITPSRLSFRIT